jgi:hypothetical protein
MSPEQRETLARRMHERFSDHAHRKAYGRHNGCEESHRTRERHDNGNEGSSHNGK